MPNIDRERLRQDIVRHEGHSATVYLDTVDVPTIGHGRNLKAVLLSRDEVQAILGSTWQLTAEEAQAAQQVVLALFTGIPTKASQVMLDNDLVRAAAVARRWVPSLDSLDALRAEALINMALNLGNRLGGFKLMLAAVEAEDWPEAKRQALNSLWARQVGGRAQELGDRLERGLEALG